MGPGSLRMRPSHVHSAAKIGAKIRMKPELKDWVWPALMVASKNITFAGSRCEAASCAGVAMAMVLPNRSNRIGLDTTFRSVLRSANRLSELPACSNRQKKATHPTNSTIASIRRSRSTLVHLVAMKTAR